MKIAPCLGGESSFHNLLDGIIDTRVRAGIEACTPCSAIDIGCGIGTALMHLYHVFGITELFGVDAKTEQESIRYWNSQQASNGPTFTSRYSFYESIQFAPPDKVLNHVPPADFSRVFNIAWRTNGADVQTPRDKYDVVIASNVLHYVPPIFQQSLLSKLTTFIHQKTIVYLRIKQRPCIMNEGDYLQMKSACRAWSRKHGLKEIRGYPDFEGDHLVYTNL